MKIILLMLFLLNSTALFSQEEHYDYDAAMNEMENKPRYGVFGNFNLNFHSTDFRSLPNVPNCCPHYQFATGTGFMFGGLFEYPFKKDWFVGGRIGYHLYAPEFKEIEHTSFIIDGQSTPGEIEHSLNTDFSRIVFNPYVSFRPINYLLLHFGVDLSLINQAKYEQIERINKPSDRVTFENGLRYRNAGSGDIDDVSAINLGLKVGASYELIISSDRSLRLVPEIFYSFSPTTPVKDLGWTTHNIDLGFAIKYIQPPPPPPPPVPPMAPPMPKPSLPAEPPKLVASVRAVEVDSLNRETPNFSVKIEDFTSLNLRPLLNFVFFEYNSSTIPERYIKISPDKAARFDMRTMVATDALETYYNVLNIIGYRLANNPQVSITLVGTNANKDSERNNRDLSMARANAVKQYFTDVWNINESRITVNARNLPREATASDEEGADDENRRVEILSSSTLLSEPVITGDTLRVLSNSTIRFYPQATSELAIKDWTLTINHNNKKIKEFSGTGNIPSQLEWQLRDDDTTSPHQAGHLSYSFIVRDEINQSFESSPQRIPIEQLTVDRKRLERREDKEFEYYRLILFDYASSNLKPEHRKVVDFIKERISRNSIVEIKGFTDRIGNDDVNMRISTQRANAVARRLNVPQARVRGVGETELIYNNDLPEGRFYCRTVTINIETPVVE